MTLEDERQHILRHEDERFAAMVGNDIPSVERLLADDLHYVHANGMVEDKNEFIRKIIAGERIFKRYEAIERETREEGRLFFVFGEATVEVERPAGLLTNRLTYTAAYRSGLVPTLFAWHAVKSSRA